MAFFDDFGKKISNLGQTAVQKTRGVTDMARLNGAVNDEEKKLNNTYREIGKIYVQLHLNDPEPPLADYVRAAVEGEQRITAYRQQIQETRGTVRCPSCGGQVTANSAFCNNCGFKLPPQQPAPQGNGTPCPHCGNIVASSMKFCNICGFKLDPQPMNGSPIPPVNPPMNGSPISPVNPPMNGNPLPPVNPPMNGNQLPPKNINCPNCGKSVDGNLKFCIMCGTKFDKPEPIPPVPPVPPTPDISPKPPKSEEKSPFARPDKPSEKEITPSDIIREKSEKSESKDDKIICSNCGADMNPELKFCTVCGTKLDPKTPPKLNLNKSNGETMRKATDTPISQKTDDKPPFTPEPPKPENKSPFAPVPPKPEDKPPFDKPVKAPKGFLDKNPDEPPKPNDDSKTTFAFAEKFKKKPDEPPKPPVSDIKCPSCGASIKSDLKFCIKCGTKLPPPPIDDKPPFIPEPPKPENKSPFAPVPPKPEDKPPFASVPPKPEDKPKKEDEFKTTFALSETAREFLEKKPELPPLPKPEDKPPFAPIPPKPEDKSPFDKPPVPLTPPKPADNSKTAFATAEDSKRPPEAPPKPPVGDTKCPSCGSPVKPGVKFCIVCGTKIPLPIDDKPPFPPKPEEKPPKPIDKPNEAQGTVCSNCNAKMKTGLKFCTACGAKLDGFFSIAKSNADKNKISPPKQAEDMLTIAKAGAVIPENKNEAPDKSDVKCPKCGLMMKSNLLYCTSCGSMLNKEKTSGTVCPSCGSSMGADLKFCTVCGSNLNSFPTPPPLKPIPPIPPVSPTPPAPSRPPVPPVPQSPSPAGVKRCHSCNSLVDSSVRFCTECGAPMDGSMPNPPVPTPDPMGSVPLGKKKCQNCSAILDADMRFCTSCGSALNDASPKPISGIGSSTVYAGSSSDMYEDYNQPTTVLSGNMFSNDDYSQPTTVLSGSPFDEEEDFSPTINLDGQMCPNCKSMMASDMLFCTECGTKL